MKPYGYKETEAARREREKPGPRTPEEELDASVEMTFPASDPISPGALRRHMDEMRRSKDKARPKSPGA